MKEKSEALSTQENLLGERMMQLLLDVAKERSEMLNTQNQIIEHSRTTLGRVQTTYQTQFKDYEEQVATTVALIKQMKKDNKAAEDKVKMNIKRTRIIIRAQ